MATIGNTVATYADVAKRLDPSGKIAKIFEVLNRYNPVVKDMLVLECNDGTGHKTTVRTGIPLATWRLLNYGVPRVKSTTAAVRDATGMLEVYAECDKALADLSGNADEYRASEAAPIMEGMTQQMAQTFFYGNVATNPERFQGIASRYSDGLASRTPSGANVLNMAGDDAANNTSAYLITFGKNATHGLYPKGSQAGLKHTNLGEQTLLDSGGGQYQGYRDHFKWDLGLTVRDWRKNARVANIKTTMLNDATTLNLLLRKLIDAAEMLPIINEDSNTDDGGENRYWYVSKNVRSALRFAILNKITNNLTFETVTGKRVMVFDDIIVRRNDAIIEAEALVPFV